MGSTVSGLNNYSSSTVQTASLVLTFLNMDASGSLMKLSQMIKIYCRFRFLNINFGP